MQIDEQAAVLEKELRTVMGKGKSEVAATLFLHFIILLHFRAMRISKG